MSIPAFGFFDEHWNELEGYRWPAKTGIGTGSQDGKLEAIQNRMGSSHP